MKRIFMIGALAFQTFLLGAAVAQEANQSSPPTTASAPNTQNSAGPTLKPGMFYLEVEASDLKAIGDALMELPKKIADPVVMKLNAQLQEQAKIAQAREEALKAPKKAD